MPPKKKKKSSKKGKKSGKEIKSDDIQIDEPELNKEFFILHIKDLERKLRLYKEKAEKLNEKNKEFLEEQSRISKEKANSINTFKKTLLQKGDELSDLKDRYQGIEQAKEAEKAKYEATLQDIQSKMQETKDNLTAEINLLSAKLSALEEFKKDKEKYLEEYRKLEEVLKETQKAHEEKLQKIQDKQFNDRDRMKKEIVSKINMVAADFRRVSQKQTSETTKRTIRENVSIKSQLTKMDDRNTELVNENEQMRQKVRENKIKLKELEKNHTELASKNNSHAKLLHMLILKFEEYKELCEEYSQEDEILLKLEEDSKSIQTMIDTRKLDIEKRSSESEEIRERLLNSKQKYNQIVQEREEAREALIGAVKELQELLSTTSKERLRSGKTSLSSASLKSRQISNEEKEWGTLLERAQADEKLQRILDYLDYEDNDGDSISTVSGVRKQSRLPSAAGAPLAPSPSMSLDSQKLLNTAKRSKTPLGPINTTVRNDKPKILSEYEIRREAQILLRQQRKGYCVPGLLQMVPNMSRHIPNNQEKAEKIHKRLIGEERITCEEDVVKPIIRPNFQTLSEESKNRFFGTVANAAASF